MRRFRAKATKAKQAQSRLKSLERMETIAAAHVDSGFRFRFEPPAALPHPLLQIDQGEVGYEQQALLSGLRLTLSPQSRIGLLGRNGAGKSTLVKLLADALPLMSGTRLGADKLHIGYFAQHQLDQLQSDWSPLRHLEALEPKATEQALRDFLGGFGFRGDDADRQVAPFSGGEKARLVLALLVWQRPNLLLLDEPTNHLDLDMRTALTRALQEYEGGVVLVSHDRHLLRSVTDEFILVSDGGAQPFAGDLDDYRQWLLDQSRAEAPTQPDKGPDRKAQRRDAALQRQAQARKRRPLERRLEKIEAQMARLRGRLDELEQQLADPAIYSDAQRQQLQPLLREQGELSQQWEQAELEWLEVGEALEAL